MKLEDDCFLAGKLDSVVKKQRRYFADKGQYSQGYGFSGSYVWFWELDHKVGRVQKNWFFRTVVLEKTLDSPLDRKGIKLVNIKWKKKTTYIVTPKKNKGNQPWILIGRTDAEAEAPILWPPDANKQLIWKDSDAGKGWRQKEGQ